MHYEIFMCVDNLIIMKHNFCRFLNFFILMCTIGECMFYKERKRRARSEHIAPEGLGAQ